MTLLKTQMGLDQMVVAPNVEHATGPVCMTCGQVVDSETLVEGYPGESTWCKVLVKHHGAEELGTFQFGSTNWDAQDLKSFMRRRNWFNPLEHEGLGLGKRIKPDLEVGPEDDRKPLIVVPK